MASNSVEIISAKRRNCGVYGLHKLFASAEDLANFTVVEDFADEVNKYTVIYVVCDVSDAAIFGKQYLEGSKWIVANGVIYGGENYIPVIEVTYSELVNLRSGSKLVPGVQYRITDFVTTTALPNTRSANHAYDIIVTAIDTYMLSEKASAAYHAGDTYFKDNGNLVNVESWELCYCLANDTKRFAWADTSTGKGVVYWMKDEFGNAARYDFKNIQYTNYKYSDSSVGDIGSVMTYSEGYGYTYGGGATTDLSLHGRAFDVIDNKLLSTVKAENGAMTLPFIVFKTDEGEIHDNEFKGKCSDLSFGAGTTNLIINGTITNVYGCSDADASTGVNCVTNTKITGVSNNILIFGESTDNTLRNLTDATFAGISCDIIDVDNLYCSGLVSKCRVDDCTDVYLGSNTVGASISGSDHIVYGYYDNEEDAIAVLPYYHNITVKRGNTHIYINSTSENHDASHIFRNIEISEGFNTNALVWKTIENNEINQSYQTKYVSNDSQIITQ